MSSVSSASSSSAAYYAQQASLFSKLDTDQDGKVSKDEFVSGRPKDVSESKASSLYSKLDTENSNGLTEDQLNEGMESNRSSSSSLESQLSSDVMAILMQLTQQGGMSFGGDSSGGMGGGQQSVSQMYADMDSDGDGSVTKAEFLAARPDDVSEEDAESFYNSIDTEGTGSITEDQLADTMKSQGPGGAGGPPPSGGGGGDNAEETYDALDTNKDGVVSIDEFLAGKPKDVSEEDATNLFNSMDTEGTGSITQEQFTEFMQSNGPEGQMGPPPGTFGDESGSSMDDILAMLQSLSTNELAEAA